MGQHPSPWNFLARWGEFLQGACVLGLVALLLAGAASWLNEQDPPRDQPTAAANDKLDLDARIRLISVSADGQYLDLLQGHDTWVRRDAHTGHDLLTRPLPVRQYLHPAISRRNDALIALIAEDRLHILQDLEVILQEEIPRRTAAEVLTSCAVSPAGNQVAVVSRLGSLWLYSEHDSKYEFSRQHALAQPLEFVRFSPTGDRLVAVTTDRRFLIWNVSQEKVVEIPTAQQADCRFAAWSGDGRRLITYGCENHLQVWDLESAGLIRNWESSSQSVSVARLSADGKLAAIADDQTITFWDVEHGRELETLKEHRGRITDLQFADGDQTLFSSDTYGGLVRYSLRDGRVVWSLS